ncbi:MAG: type secretion chaperone [Chlamydiota bacterium]|jgi:hypothetical protein
MLATLLVKLKEDLELEEVPQKDPSGRYVFTLNPEQTLFFKEAPPSILLTANVGSFPQKDQEEFCLLVMKGNFLGQGTGNCVLGLDENEKFLTLSSSLPYEVDYPSFKVALEEFANFLNYWQGELMAFQEQS